MRRAPRAGPPLPRGAWGHRGAAGRFRRRWGLDVDCPGQGHSSVIGHASAVRTWISCCRAGFQDDARHHRDQAERWLEMARHMSDPLAANLLRDAAARHLAQARELEEQVRAGRSQSPEAPEERLSDFSDSFYYRAMRTAIGGALRDELAPTEPTPGRLSNALKALDGPKSGDAGGNDEEGEGPPGHQRVRAAENGAGGCPRGDAGRRPRLSPWGEPFGKALKRTTL
jgi:hypothetical protein